jgi:type II secretory pathway pseudopilin PulG
MRPTGIRGFTLIEVLISAALLIVLALLFAPMFHMSQVTLTTNDARSLMKEQAERVAGRISGNLRESRRIFSRRIVQMSPLMLEDNFSGSIGLTGFPVPLDGSVLPVQKNANNENSGNALFFARQLPSVDVQAGTRGDMRIDVYRFYYYYVALTPNDPDIARKPSRQLYEWKSVPYADVGQLNQIPNDLDRQEAVKKLTVLGVSWAYDISLVDFTGAFFQLDPLSGDIVLAVGHSIVGAGHESLTRSSGGRIFSNFQLGICPNSADLGVPTSIPVPRVPSASWTRLSPSGFEVVSVGSSLKGQRGNTLMQIRLVLVVSGPIKFPFLQYEEDVSVNVRDIW